MFNISFEVGRGLILPFYYRRGLLEHWKKKKKKKSCLWSQSSEQELESERETMLLPWQCRFPRPLHTCKDTLPRWQPLGWLPLSPDCTSRKAELGLPCDNPLSFSQGKRRVLNWLPAFSGLSGWDNFRYKCYCCRSSLPTLLDYWMPNLSSSLLFSLCRLLENRDCTYYFTKTPGETLDTKTYLLGTAREHPITNQ